MLDRIHAIPSTNETTARAPATALSAGVSTPVVPATEATMYAIPRAMAWAAKTTFSRVTPKKLLSSRRKRVSVVSVKGLFTVP